MRRGRGRPTGPASPRPPIPVEPVPVILHLRCRGRASSTNGVATGSTRHPQANPLSTDRGSGLSPGSHRAPPSSRALRPGRHGPAQPLRRVSRCGRAAVPALRADAVPPPVAPARPGTVRPAAARSGRRLRRPGPGLSSRLQGARAPGPDRRARVGARRRGRRGPRPGARAGPAGARPLGRGGGQEARRPARATTRGRRGPNPEPVRHPRAGHADSPADRGTARHRGAQRGGARGGLGRQVRSRPGRGRDRPGGHRRRPGHDGQHDGGRRPGTAGGRGPDRRRGRGGRNAPELSVSDEPQSFTMGARRPIDDRKVTAYPRTEVAWEGHGSGTSGLHGSRGGPTGPASATVKEDLGREGATLQPALVPVVCRPRRADLVVVRGRGRRALITAQEVAWTSLSGAGTWRCRSISGST